MSVKATSVVKTSTCILLCFENEDGAPDGGAAGGGGSENFKGDSIWQLSYYRRLYKMPASLLWAQGRGLGFWGLNPLPVAFTTCACHIIFLNN